jgi:serine/threonine-protein kinase
MAKDSQNTSEFVTFLRRRDYRFVKGLGQGACGQTVLLHDDQIDEHFVCKKYVPPTEQHRQELFQNFVREIKLLHQVHHVNVVRIFNYFVFPAQAAGYILMEYVAGSDVDDFLRSRPELINEVFVQTIAGFAHLEHCGILHRDIRPGNLMVRSDGVVKIIDLGFGKRIDNSEDFNKSITLNWWCRPPDEFKAGRYDFTTEVYFVGKLFEKLIQDLRADNFNHDDLLRRMCQADPATRIKDFAEVEQLLHGSRFSEIDFSEEQQEAYRVFASAIARSITKIENTTKYATDVNQIVVQLDELYRSMMLEETVPDTAVVTRCFITGTYFYKNGYLQVDEVKNFLKLLKTSTEDQRRIVLANLHTRLNAIKRYSPAPPSDDDMPF